MYANHDQMTEATTQNYFQDRTRRVHSVLEQRLPPEDTPPQPLHAAMRYSVFAGGKRLRPLLCLAAATAVGADDSAALLPAAALAGGSLLVVADTLARTVVAPQQLPVGVLTALLGVPVFLYLLSRQAKGGAA